MCIVVNALIFPFTVIAYFCDVFSNQIIQSTRQVVGVPSTISIEVTDFAAHFAIWLCSLHTSRPASLLHTYDGHNMIFGYSCRALFETAMVVLKRDLCNGKPVRILTTPVHHKSLVLIMERLTDSIEILTLDERNRSINVDEATEEAVKNCDIIVITHMFGRNFDLSKLIELKKKHNKILIVDSVMGGARRETYAVTDADLDIYSTGQDKRPIAIGGGYCIYRHKIFAAMEAEIMSYAVVTRWERLQKLANTLLLRQVYNNKSLVLFLLTVAPMFGLTTTEIVADVRKNNPGFDHNGYLRCPSEALCRSMKLELGNEKPMEDRFIHCWRLFLESLPEPLRRAYYPQYEASEPVILPYNQIILPPGHKEQFLAFCDKHRICGATNQNYMMMTNSAPQYHEFIGRVHNLPTAIGSDDDIPCLVEALVQYMAEDTVTVPQK